MIHKLSIQNLILVEKAHIEFGEGLNIITGETGSGKSALLTAIRLLLGARADIQQIRQGASLAVVEAQLSPLPIEALQEEGIECRQTETVSLRREIHSSGKSRCFFEEQQISLTTLKKIVGSSIELVDQNTSATLCSHSQQRKWLDLFAGLEPAVSLFNTSYNQELSLASQLEAMHAEKRISSALEERAQSDLTAIEEANVSPGEEEALAQEHHLLSHSQQLVESIHSILSLLQEGQHPVISALKRIPLDHLLQFDSRLIDPCEAIKRSGLELEEAAFSLRAYADRLEADPHRLFAVEERLAVIEKLKKRFGPMADIDRVRKERRSQIDRLSHLEDQIQELEKALHAIRLENRNQAAALRHAREQAAPLFSRAIETELSSLNLSQSRFAIEITPKELSANGFDEISFVFSANPGYPLLRIDQCASGGEISRLLLAVKTVLANREKSGCLIFDEIDSNVGGQTATILGAKLQALARHAQVICVTHFVQVARCAAHHFLVSKQNSTTKVQKLDPLRREEEFSRMLGLAQI